MSKSKVIIEILAERIEMLVYEDQVCISSDQLPLESSSDVNQWAGHLRRTAPLLREWVGEKQLTDCPAMVVYNSATQTVDIHSLAVRSQSQAIEAAKLTCVDSLSYSAITAICRGQFVGRDARKNNPQSHVVVAAEREDVADAIAFLISESGLDFVSAVPTTALIALHGVQSILSDHQPHHAKLYIGEQNSLFLIGHQGDLLFSRRIALGLETLVKSILHPIRVGQANQEIELPPEQARDILENYGIPGRDDVVHEQHHLSGSHILPLMQPVLQRFIVELRQSLRFGLGEEDRRQLTITLTGPGSKIPNLSALIQQELEVETLLDSAYQAWDYSKPGTDSVLIDVALQNETVFDQVNLQPQQIVQQKRIGKIRRYLWTGAAAALVLVGVDAMRYQSRLSDVRKQVDLHATQIADLEALQETGERLQSSLGAMNNLERTIETQVGRRSNFHACLHELSRITPGGIRFDQLMFQPKGNGTVGVLTGYSLESSKDAAQQELEKCIALLRSSPLFDGVTLNSVKRGSLGEMQGQRFSLTLEVHQVYLPDNGLASAVVDGGTQQ